VITLLGLTGHPVRVRHDADGFVWVLIQSLTVQEVAAGFLLAPNRWWARATRYEWADALLDSIEDGS
jgi:hypothetical protein